MMPKVTLLAPDGVRGQIHASQSGKNYDIAEDGTVVVDHNDVTDLLTGGYTHVHRHHSAAQRDPAQPPVSSVATGSHEAGATAIDPANRETFRRPSPLSQEQPSQDFGDAAPPHGKGQPQPSTDASRADAQEEVDQAARDGADPEHRSQVADTGHMGTDQPNAGDQAEARGEKQDPDPSDHHDRAYGEFKDHAKQEGEGDPPTLRGKTKAEIDAGKAG